MSDIVDELRSPAVFIADGQFISPVAYAAAAEIERLREALDTYLCTCPDGYCEAGTFDDTICGHRARAALAKGGE